MSRTDRRSESYSMHIIVILFGIGSWIAINGVWVELPILVQQLPEGWSLPSFLVILMQAANIGPLVVAMMQWFCAKYYHQNVLIHIILIMGTTACFCLIFFWDWNININGSSHSVVFFTLFFMLSFVDCTSSITFLPFMTKFQTVFITSCFVGEGLSGFLPSVFALIQGVSVVYCDKIEYLNTTTNETQNHVVAEYYEPRFSVEIFFVLLTLMMTGSYTAYLMLNYLNLVKTFIQDSEKITSKENDSSSFTELSALHPTTDEHSRRHIPKKKEKYTSPDEPNSELTDLSLKNHAYLYTIVFWINGIANGVMPSVITYFSLPYGQLPNLFAVALGAMTGPVACVIAMYLPAKSLFMVGLYSLSATGFAAYLMFLALESPCPVLVGTNGGAAIMVTTQIIFSFAISYAKVSIGQILRERGRKRSLVWYGAFTQLGSLTGACVVFPLINVYHFFTPGDQCNTAC